MRKDLGKVLTGMALTVLLLAAMPLRGVEAPAAAPSEKSRFSIGAGLGIPFGVIGLSLEFNPILGGTPSKISDYYSLNIGLGYAVASVGYSIGLRFYPLGRDRAWAPKLSINYGAVAVVNWSYLVRGFSLGAGVIRRLKKKLTLDADLIFILNYFGFDYIDWSDIGRLKISCGLRWNLD